jgi:hypothetical protein
MKTMREAMQNEPIDDVAARAVAALRRDVSTRSLPELRGHRPRHWIGWIAVVAAVTVVVVGLVAIGTNRNESVGNDQARLRWLVRDLPSGWKPDSVFDSATAPARQIPDSFAMNVYATDAAPLGPMLTVQGTTDTTQEIELGSYSGDVVSYEEVELGGKRAAFATLQNGGRGLYIEINSVWVYLSSRGISDDGLRELATTLTPDAAGHYDVGESALPDGLHKVVSTSDPLGDVVSVSYISPGETGGYLELATLPAAAVLMGSPPPTSFDLQPVSIGDFSGFVGSLTSDTTAPPITAWTVLWRRDGLDFELTGQGLTREQILAAAASASPASPDEWEHLLGSQIIGPGDTAPVATSPAEVPTETAPTIAGGPRDVAITVKVDDVSPNDEKWSGVLPTGESWSVKVTRVYDRMNVRYEVGGNVSSVFGLRTDPPTGTSIVCCHPTAITNNPNATALRVLRSDGDRYTIPLHDLPGTGGVRVAFIALPDNVLAELLDADGNVLESYAPH